MLIQAIEEGIDEQIHRLLNQGVDHTRWICPEYTALHMFTQAGSINNVKLMLDNAVTSTLLQMMGSLHFTVRHMVEARYVCKYYWTEAQMYMLER